MIQNAKIFSVGVDRSLLPSNFWLENRPFLPGVRFRNQFIFKLQEGLKSASFQPFLFVEFFGCVPFPVKGFLKRPVGGKVSVVRTGRSSGFAPCTAFCRAQSEDGRLASNPPSESAAQVRSPLSRDRDAVSAPSGVKDDPHGYPRQLPPPAQKRSLKPHWRFSDLPQPVCGEPPSFLALFHHAPPPRRRHRSEGIALWLDKIQSSG